MNFQFLWSHITSHHREGLPEFILIPPVPPPWAQQMTVYLTHKFSINNLTNCFTMFIARIHPMKSVHFSYSITVESFIHLQMFLKIALRVVHLLKWESVRTKGRVLAQMLHLSVGQESPGRSTDLWGPRDRVQAPPHDSSISTVLWKDITYQVKHPKIW